MFYEPLWEYQGHKLVRRPDSEYYYITWCRTGTSRLRRRSTRTTDLDLAKERLVEFVRARTSVGPLPLDAIGILDVLTSYVDSVRRRTAAEPETRALAWWTEFLHAHDIVLASELTRAAQEHYVDWRRRSIRARGYIGSNGTIARELRVMRSAFNEAQKDGLVLTPPRIIGLSEPPPRQRFLFPEEVDRLIAECETIHLYRFVMIALHTLQRPGAVLGLKTEQVDLRSGLIDFLPPGCVQTRKRKPVVPISETIFPILEDAIEHSWSGYVIEWNGARVACIRNAFGKACLRAGLEGVSPYTLRHTGATLLLAQGVSIRQVAGMMGHTEHRTTELYGKHHVDFLGDARRAVDRLFRPRSTDLDEEPPGLTLIPSSPHEDHRRDDRSEATDQTTMSSDHSWTPRIV